MPIYLVVMGRCGNECLLKWHIKRKGVKGGGAGERTT